MPTCVFILSRFTLRVDHVLFRTHDTRIYHSFASEPPLIIREISGWEAPYDRVKRVKDRYYTSPLSDMAPIQQLPRRDDLTPLTDPMFIAKVLTGFPKQLSQQDGANTGWRGLRERIDIAVLKKRQGS